MTYHFFEILGITKTWFGGADKIYPEQIQVSKNGKETRVTKLNDGAAIAHKTAPLEDTFYKIGKCFYTQVYARVLIKFLRRGL